MIETDDEMFRVDNHYLGPAGKTLPKPVRYKAVGFGVLIGFAVYVVLFVLLGLPAKNWSITMLLVATVWLTRRFLDYLGYERTVRSMFRSAAHDLTSPRPMSAKDIARAADKARPHTVSVDEQIGRIRFGDNHSESSAHPTGSTSQKAAIR